jgi:hypothetical protein
VAGAQAQWTDTEQRIYTETRERIFDHVLNLFLFMQNQRISKVQELRNSPIHHPDFTGKIQNLRRGVPNRGYRGTQDRAKVKFQVSSHTVYAALHRQWAHIHNLIPLQT